jgi:uncharacterized SAM-binding protein YcdF (DUF218 family)
MVVTMTYVNWLLTFALAVITILVYRLPTSRTKQILGLTVLATFLLAWSPCEYVLARHLEDAYPLAPFRAVQGLDAIVVLSAGVSPPQFERPYPLLDYETFTRCEYALWMYRTTMLPVLVSGGRNLAQQAPFASTMSELLVNSGIPPGMIWLEDRSLSTHENAVFSAEVLRRHGARRIALVVDARSMRRASACFRHEGIEVVAAPSKFLYITATLEDWLPGWKAIRGNELNLHETLGLLWYRVRGWI